MVALANALNPRQAANAVIACLKASAASTAAGGITTTPLLVGKPGTCKTSICRQIAAILGYDGIVIFTPTTYNVFDLRGLPHVIPFQSGHMTKFAPSGILPTSGKWLILVDELADCPLHEQSGFYQLFLDRKCGEWTAPPECDIVGATNDSTMGACANELSTALKTRVVVLNVKSEVESTISYAIRKDWHPTVISFIRAYPEVLDGFDAEDYAGGATGRGLEQLSILEKSGLPECLETVKAISCGTIGNLWGARYSTFRQIKVPDPNAVFSNPDNCEVPPKSSPDKLHFFLALAASRCDTLPQFTSAARFAKRLDRVQRCGFLVDCIRTNKRQGKTEFQSSSIYGALLAECPELLI